MNHGGSGRLPITLRAMGGRDLPGLLPMIRSGVRLDLPDAAVSEYLPMSGLVRGRWNPLRNTRYRTYLAATGHTPLAFVQVGERATDPRTKWDLVYLGIARSAAVASPSKRVELWSTLLGYVATAAGRRGVQRLYAKVASGSDVAEAFHAASYSRYGEETIFFLDQQYRATAAATDPLNIRPQVASDTWALHQLYTLTAPKTVQYAEAYTSQHWELPQKRLLLPNGRLREYGFVVERGHEIAIYCRVRRQGYRSRLEFVYEAAARALLLPTIEAVLRWLTPGPSDRVYCTAREFQAELASDLQVAGFTAKGGQDVLVRYTMVSVRPPELVAVTQTRRKGRLFGVPVGSLQRQA